MKLLNKIIDMERIFHVEDVARLERFQEGEGFDEVPLYSRYHQLDFLKREPPENRDDIMIGSACLLLERLVSRLVTAEPFFAAITVLDEQAPAAQRFLVPRIFLCCKHPRTRLAGLNGLRHGRSALARRLGASLMRLGVRRRYTLCDDLVTVPEHVRVFLGHTRPLTPRMLSLSELSCHSK